MAWYNTNWTYRKKITVDNTKVSANLTDFPIYVDLSDLGTDFFSNVNIGGGDIRVTKADGVTELARELVSIDTVSLTGELHFKGDALNSTTDTEFYIYYGNAAASDYAVTDTFGRNNVWSNYKCVYHMAQDPSGSAPQMIDSTGNGNNLTSSGSMTSGDLVSGQVGDAIDFDGSNDYLGINYNSDFDLTNSDLTISLLVKTSSSSSYRQIVSKMGSSTSNFDYQLGINDLNKAFFTTGSGGYWTDATGTSNINTGTWKYLVGTKVHAGNSKVYVDGTQEANVSSVNIGNSTNVPITVGARSNTGIRSQFFPAQIDEVRLSANALSADFIDAMVINHTSASTFYAVGTQEQDTTINIVSISPAHESTGNAIDTNLVITYDNNATAGTGSLTITQRDGLIIGDGFAGKIGELILTNENLSQDTIEKVEGYLAWKWFGINNPLPDSHPYKLRRPVI